MPLVLEQQNEEEKMKYKGPFNCRYCRAVRGRSHKAGCPRLRKTLRSRRLAEKYFYLGYHERNALEVRYDENLNTSYRLGLKFAKSAQFVRQMFRGKNSVYNSGWGLGF